jgi:drug/metabolite transporter (DMT)-like permease
MSRRGGTAAYVALAAVCFFWGTTYLAIRISIETLPPAFAIAARFIASGSILLIAARLRNAHLPRGRELWIACGCGCLILGIGNAASFYSELFIPSGLVGLLTTLSPFWMTGIEAMTGGERLNRVTIVGMAIGFAGTSLLLLPGSGGFGKQTLIGLLIMQVGIIGWTGGSVIQRRQKIRAHPIVIGAVQQLAAGILYIPITLFVPHPAIVLSSRSVLALVYLVIFGSIVAYSAYIFAMDRLPVAIASSYPYINAVVAMWLGWLFFSEPFGLRETAAMAIIFAGLAVVKSRSGIVRQPKVPQLPSEAAKRARA